MAEGREGQSYGKWTLVFHINAFKAVVVSTESTVECLKQGVNMLQLRMT